MINFSNYAFQQCLHVNRRYSPHVDIFNIEELQAVSLCRTNHVTFASSKFQRLKNRRHVMYLGYGDQQALRCRSALRFHVVGLAKICFVL